MVLVITCIMTCDVNTTKIPSQTLVKQIVYTLLAQCLNIGVMIHVITNTCIMTDV